MHSILKRSIWKTLVLINSIIFLSFSIVFVLSGRVNVDEGWYLYASKLVFLGEIPYRDFPFTQTPLLPYAYGLVQYLFPNSLYVGRIITVFISLIAYALSLITSRQMGGEKAAGIVSLLWATFTYGIYFQSITKTYALVSLFFVGVFFVQVSTIPKEWKVLISTFFVLLATLTRLSALFFALPILLVGFFTSERKTKLKIIGLSLATALWVFLLFASNPEATTWGLVSHHTSQWGDISVFQRVKQILFGRIPQLLQVYPSFFLFAVILLGIGHKEIIDHYKQNRPILTLTIALFLFAIPNLLSGGFHPEYFVPFVFLTLIIIGVLYVKVVSQRSGYSKLILQVAFLSTVLLGVIRGGFAYIDISDGALPIEEIKKVSQIIQENTQGDDSIYAMEALYVVFESDRSIMPNLAMALFSFLEVDTNKVTDLNLINSELTYRYFETKEPKIILLTDLDRGILQTTNYYEKIQSSIERNYVLLLSKENFGQHNSKLEVFIRR